MPWATGLRNSLQLPMRGYIRRRRFVPSCHRHVPSSVPQPDCRAASSKIVALKDSFLCLHHLVPLSMFGSDIVAPSSGCVADKCSLRVCAMIRRCFSGGCKPHLAIAPAGSNRSSHGGDEMAESSGVEGHELVSLDFRCGSTRDQDGPSGPRRLSGVEPKKSAYERTLRPEGLLTL